MEKFKSFKDAAVRAKATAIASGEIVTLQHSDNFWSLLYFDVTKCGEDLYDGSDDESSYDDSNDQYTYNDYEIEQNDIRKELASDTSDFARSEENGWFYDEN